LCNRSSDAVIENNVMIENSAHSYGGAICMWNSDALIVNNTLAFNLAPFGGGYSSEGSSPLIVNTIFWDDSAHTGCEIHIENGPDPIVEYCDIEGGWSGEGNISVDPLFRDPDNGDFHLMSTACGDPLDSPCIDSGDPSIFDYLLDCDWGLGGERSDMGAYGGQAIPTDIREEPDPEIPVVCGLLQNYPNPFNATTTLSYMLPQAGPVVISVYNLLGQLVETIFQGEQQTGSHSLIWDAGDLASGVYFARLEAGEYSQSVKMVLLK
jgi:hypothetical protein